MIFFTFLCTYHLLQGFQHKQHKQAYGFKKKFNDVGAFKKHFSDHGLFGKKQAGFSGMSKKASRFKVIQSCVVNAP